MKEKILAYMRNDAYRPLAAEELADNLNLKNGELETFWEVLHEMEGEAEVIKTRFDKYGLPERMNLIVGRFDATSKGYGFVVSDKPDEKDIFIPAHSMLNVMHNDRVVVRVHKRLGDRSPEGEIIRIVKRANSKVVGTFELSRNFGFIIPDDKRLGQDIFVAKEDTNGARNGQKVVAEIIEWPEGRKRAEAKVTEVLGFKGDPGIEILSIIKQHDLPMDFPAGVNKAAAHIPLTVQPEDLLGRRDLRQAPIVTIDSEDAKDLDDGVEVEKLSNGRFLLGVHIADVSYYVRENSAIDIEARERGTSVYLVDRVIPMLPQRLSNGICSLNAGEDRLAVSAYLEIDEQGQVRSYEFFPSVIHVKTRLSYNIVRNVLAEEDPELLEQYSSLVPQLKTMQELCLILRGRRLRRGAIDFDFAEQKVKVDETGRPVEIIQRVRSIAESIIEEFMLVANETVAEHMNRLQIPFIYRVHEEPDSEKMEKLNLLLHNFGEHLAISGDIQPIMLQRVLKHIAGRPEERIISSVMLRSLKQAKYDAQSLGHFGLAAGFYTHFTSPIRRYPDLIVHRLLRATWEETGISAKRRKKLATALPDIALHSSKRERAAADAERETVELKMAEYMSEFVGQQFDGHISGVLAFGIFVELDNGVEGLVHVSSMDDDYYQYHEQQYALIGERTRKVYRLGDAVSIKVGGVNIDERKIDFVLTEHSAEYFNKNQQRKPKINPQPDETKQDRHRSQRPKAAKQSDKADKKRHVAKTKSGGKDAKKKKALTTHAKRSKSTARRTGL